MLTVVRQRLNDSSQMKFKRLFITVHQFIMSHDQWFPIFHGSWPPTHHQLMQIVHSDNTFYFSNVYVCFASSSLTATLQLTSEVPARGPRLRNPGPDTITHGYDDLNRIQITQSTGSRPYQHTAVKCSSPPLHLE